MDTYTIRNPDDELDENQILLESDNEVELANQVLVLAMSVKILCRLVALQFVVTAALCISQAVGWLR